LTSDDVGVDCHRKLLHKSNDIQQEATRPRFEFFSFLIHVQLWCMRCSSSNPQSNPPILHPTIQILPSCNPAILQFLVRWPMAAYLDSVPLSGIIRIRDMMYSVADPYRLDQGDGAPEDVHP